MMKKLNQLQLISQLYSYDPDDSDEQNLNEEILIDDSVQDNSNEDGSNGAELEQVTSKQISLEEILTNDSTNNHFVADKNIKCAVCLSTDFKYKCPSCLIQTCSLNCFKCHKFTMKCSGLRDTLKFKRMASFDDDQLRSDFHFLEDYNRQIDGIKRQKRNIVQSLTELPNWLKKLKYEANRRLIKLKILPAGFKRRLQNKTTFMYSTKEIQWDIEFVFTDLHIRQIDQKCNDSLVESDGQKSDVNKADSKINSLKKITFHIQRVPEKRLLNDLLVAYLKPINLIENQHLNSLLRYYQNANEDEIATLIKLPFGYYLELDRQMTVNDCLKHKTIIEYPTIFVVLRKNLCDYRLIEEEDLRNRMQTYANESYDLLIKNRLVNKHFGGNENGQCSNERKFGGDRNFKKSTHVEEDDSSSDSKIDDSFNEAKMDDLMNDPKLGHSLKEQISAEYYEESDDDNSPLEVETRYVFDNLYNDDQRSCDL